MTWGRSPDGTWTLLGAEAPGAPGVWSEAAAINASGTVVGTSSDGGDTFTVRAFSWTESGGFEPVPVDVPGYLHSAASDVNASGQVVGQAFDSTATGPGFLYTPREGTTELVACARRDTHVRNVVLGADGRDGRL
jgi:probable HAF family extracellular repeat protein